MISTCYLSPSECAAEIAVIMERIHEGNEASQETERHKERVQDQLRGRQERLSKLAMMHQNKVHVLLQQIEADTM